MMILVVDDEKSICELMAEILAENYNVIKAFDGIEALSLARAQKPDLIVSDIMMPQMSGTDLLQALRADPQLSSIPVILVSAVVPQQTAEKANAFIRKPFDVEKLEQVVRQVCAQYRFSNKGYSKSRG